MIVINIYIYIYFFFFFFEQNDIWLLLNIYYDDFYI